MFKFQDMSISNSSTNARLITIAQDNLNDTENWPNSEREQSATEMESGAEATTSTVFLGHFKNIFISILSKIAAWKALYSYFH